MLNIKLNLTLIKYKNESEFGVAVTQTACLADILDSEGIPQGEIGMVIKNGRWAPIDCEVTGADSVELFPPLSGG